MDLPSSLELFLLAAVEEGCATAYDLHAQAGLSVGSTLPALQRMVKKGWLEVETAGGRGRMQHQLTSKGRRELGTWRVYVDQAIQKPPFDIDSLFRLMSVAWYQRDKARLKKLLSVMNEKLSERVTEKDAATCSPDLSGFHRWLSRLQAIEQDRSNLRLFKEISVRLRNR